MSNLEPMDHVIRPASEPDRSTVISMVEEALSPYYGGDHGAHARRIFDTHIKGGMDHVGHFSLRQTMLVAADSSDRVIGMVHLVDKRQGTVKISPLIVVPGTRGGGIGRSLLTHAEDFARKSGARQMYCTVAMANQPALRFFLRNGYTPAGRSASHYKAGITETMLYKRFAADSELETFDRPHLSVLPLDLESHGDQARQLLLDELPATFSGIDDDWVDALFSGYERRYGGDINTKFKLLFVAEDRTHRVQGIAGTTPKKGEPIKVMPLVAATRPAFNSLLTDLPGLLHSYGHKLYAHVTPTPDETVLLQQRGWSLDAAMPHAYRDGVVTQQWSYDITSEDSMPQLRLKQRFLDAIRAGDKTLEVRVGYSQVKRLNAGDRLRFASRNDFLDVEIRDIRTYNSIDSLLDVEDHTAIVVGSPSRESVRNSLVEIYPPHKQKLGVYAIEIQAMEPSRGNASNARDVSN